MPPVRRLTAILAADVAGYSRLMGTDEEGTHARLKAHLGELVEPMISQHRGRTVKNTGGGLLAEFVTDTSRRRWLHRFTMHSRETEVRQSLTRSLHTATTDIVSSSERVARKSGDRWSKAILPGNQRNSARDELWRTKRAWIETGGVLRRTTAYGAQGPYDKRQEAR